VTIGGNINAEEHCLKCKQTR